MKEDLETKISAKEWKSVCAEVSDDQYTTQIHKP